MVLISFVSWKKHRNMKFCQVAIPDDAKLAMVNMYKSHIHVPAY